MSDTHELLARALPMLVQLGDFIGNGVIDATRADSLGARCDLIGDIKSELERHTRKRGDPDAIPLMICPDCGHDSCTSTACACNCDKPRVRATVQPDPRVRTLIADAAEEYERHGGEEHQLRDDYQSYRARFPHSDPRD